MAAAPSLQTVSLAAATLGRGFWLYVCRVTLKTGETLHYVGMTGDAPSGRAASLFSRVSAHLGGNIHSNALQKRLRGAGFETTDCETIEFFGYGPIFEEVEKGDPLHVRRHADVSALEKALCDAIRGAGYTVLNDVRSRKALDLATWAQVCEAFSDPFPKLRAAL